MAHSFPAAHCPSVPEDASVDDRFRSSEGICIRSVATGTAQIWPTHGPRGTADGLRNRSLCMQETVTQDYVTGYDLRKRVAGDGFEPS